MIHARHILAAPLLLACALTAAAQEPTPSPTPPPLGGRLTAAVETDRVVTVRETVTEWSVQWMLVDPEQRRITVQVAPFGWQIVLDGAEYDAASAAIRPLLENTLLPAIGQKIIQRNENQKLSENLQLKP